MGKKIKKLLFIVVVLFSFFYVFADSTNPGKIVFTKKAERVDNQATSGRKTKISLNVSANNYVTKKKTDVVVVFDNSGSMSFGSNGEGDNTISRREQAKNSLKAFANKFLNENEGARIGMITFDQEADVHFNFTNDKRLISNRIDNINRPNGNGGTNLDHAIQKANDMLKASNAEEKLLLILTDGEPTYAFVNGRWVGNGYYDEIENSFLCYIKPGCRHCDKKPSEYAKISLDKLKLENNLTNIYTITFGNEPKAAEKLAYINSEKEGKPIYKNTKALNADELTKILESIKTEIGKDTIVEDVIPNTFKLSDEEKNKLINQGVEVIEGNDGTTKIKWNIGLLKSDENHNLEFVIEPRNENYGYMYTNKYAKLSSKVEKDNPAYNGNTNITEEVANPAQLFEAVVKDDHYNEIADYNGYENNTLVSTTPITKNDSSNLINDDSNLEIKNTVEIIENVDSNLGTLVMNNDNTFKFTPKNKVTGEITFKYRVKTSLIDKNTGKALDEKFSNVATVTLNLEPKAKRELEINKIWNDAQNRDGLRKNIKATLYANYKNKKVEIGEYDLTKENGYKQIVSDLDLYEDGHELDQNYIIEYSVDEEVVPTGYTKEINGTTITNTHIAEVKKITIAKVWDDNNNQDGFRPSEVIFDIFNGNELVKTVVLSANNFEEEIILPKNENGQEINYNVVERDVDYYESSLKQEVNKYVFTNTHKPLTKKLILTKVWEDQSNLEGFRPKFVTIQVKYNGQLVDEVTISKQNGNRWIGTSKLLPVYENGNKINYTIDEVNTSDKYNKQIKGLTIINSRQVEKFNYKVKKVWDDNNNNDGKRPAKVKIKLLEGSTVIREKEIDTMHDTEIVFENVQKYRNKEIIKYTVVEEQEQDSKYIPSIEYDNDYTSATVINKYNPETFKYTIRKVWDDNNDQDGFRPNKLNVKLFADGDLVGTYLLSGNDNWTKTIELPVYKNGQKINYLAEEEDIPHYKSEYQDASETHTTFKNTHDVLKTSVIVKKVWEDNDNNDGKRPEEIKVKLLKNKQVIAEKIITPDANGIWQTEFNDLDLYENGRQVEYSVEEEVIEGYTSKINMAKDNNGTTIVEIINKHDDSEINITITKTWVGDKEENRPKEIEVKVYMNNEENGSFTLSKENNWTETLRLPEYSEGKKINYTIEEIKVENYKTSIDGFNITNTYINKDKETGNTSGFEIIPPKTGINYNSNYFEKIFIFIYKLMINFRSIFA